MLPTDGHRRLETPRQRSLAPTAPPLWEVPTGGNVRGNPDESRCASLHTLWMLPRDPDTEDASVPRKRNQEQRDRPSMAHRTTPRTRRLHRRVVDSEIAHRTTS